MLNFNTKMVIYKKIFNAIVSTFLLKQTIYIYIYFILNQMPMYLFFCGNLIVLSTLLSNAYAKLFNIL